jgi:hypothetical protein
MLRSATFTIGLLLAGAAFVGFLMLGGVMAPPPYSVVVAVQDIPAYSTLNSALWDRRRGLMVKGGHSFCATRLMITPRLRLRNHPRGEPLRKVHRCLGNRKVNRLALVMNDPTRSQSWCRRRCRHRARSHRRLGRSSSDSPQAILRRKQHAFQIFSRRPAISPIIAFGPTPASSCSDSDSAPTR